MILKKTNENVLIKTNLNSLKHIKSRIFCFVFLAIYYYPLELSDMLSPRHKASVANHKHLFGNCFSRILIFPHESSFNEKLI